MTTGKWRRRFVQRYDSSMPFRAVVVLVFIAIFWVGLLLADQYMVGWPAWLQGMIFIGWCFGLSGLLAWYTIPEDEG